MPKSDILGCVNFRLVAEALVALGVVGGLTLSLQLGGTSFSSRIWPLVLLVLMAAVSVILLISGLLGGGRRSAETASTVATVDGDHPLQRYGMIAAYTVLVLVLPAAGFALTTLVFVPLAACILGMPRQPKSFVIALALAIGIYLMFTVAFDVPLPSGVTGAVTRWFVGG